MSQPPCAAPNIRFEEIFSLVVAVLNNSSYFGVDLDGGAFRVVDFLCEVSTEKYFFFFLAERHGTELLAHAPFANHTACQIGGFFDIVAGARGHMVEAPVLPPPDRRTRMTILLSKYSLAYVCFSSIGSCCVRPKAMPRGMIVTL